MHQHNPFVRSLAVLSIVLIGSTTSARGQCPTWLEGFHLPGLGGPNPTTKVLALGASTDGPGPIWIGGYQLQSPGIAAPGAPICAWDGTTVTTVGALSSSTRIDCIARWDDGSGPATYVGGSFTDAGLHGIARWDGTTWQPVGNGLNGHVRALAVFDDGGGAALYAAGDFLTSGGSPLPYIARWRNGAWTAVGSSGTGPDSYVWALETWDDGTGEALYAGGSFLGIGSGPARRVARWDGTTWSPVGTGLGQANGTVMTLAVHDEGNGEKLFAGGSFTTDGSGSPMRAIARFDGTAWSALPALGGSGLSWDVRALVSGDVGQGSRLYATGTFDTAGGVSANGIASWNGVRWSALGSGLRGDVLAVHDVGSGPAVFAGGVFDTAGDQMSPRVARWDGSAWSSLQSGNGLVDAPTVTAMHDDGTGPALYAGGPMDFAGSTPVRGVARWNGASWLALGASTGERPTVLALQSHDDGSGPALYAGGEFTSIGGAAISSVARWNGSAWSPVGPAGSTATVRAFAEFDDGTGNALYAGGSFGVLGTTYFENVARWNGSAWSAVGTGLNGGVYALVVHDDGTGPKLYAGGQFTQAGSQPALRIARWNGSTWTQVGPGVGSVRVNALHVHDNGQGPKLYIGGSFSLPAVPGIQTLARWTGSALETFGPTPAFSIVNSFATFDDGTGRGPELFVGGAHADGNLMRFDGANWSSVNGGVNSAVHSLGTFEAGAGPTLFVTGRFEYAGGSKSSVGIAGLTSCGETGRTICVGDGSGTPCPCGNDSAAGDRDGCSNSLGLGGRLRASGTPSLTLDTVSLIGAQMPNSSVLYFQGTTGIDGGMGSPFGDGLRCAGGGVVRIRAVVNVAGTSSYPGAGDAPLATKGAVTQPGSRVYQAWYRNAASFCTASTFNLTNGVQIVWTR